MSFRHKAIYGLTGMGKTYLMKRRIKALLKYKQRVLVYTGTGDISFPSGSKITTFPDELEKWLANPENFGSYIFIDEAAALYDEIGYKATKHPTINGLFMRGRHCGYTCFIATQYPKSIPPRVRINCLEAYCFRLVDKEAARQVSEDYGSPEISGVPAHEKIICLEKLEFIRFFPPEAPQIMRI